MAKFKNELKTITLSNNGGEYAVGMNADRIELVTDGDGPCGYYDMIYVHFQDETVAFPAHNLQSWSYVTPSENQNF